MNDFELKIFSSFEAALKFGPNTSPKELIYNEFPGWDSVAHMIIIAELEEVFDCMMEIDDVLDLSSFEKACEIMKKYTP